MIWMHKGFIMINPDNNQDLFNKLYMSSFLSRHPRNRNVFYCMKNNTALNFFHKYKTFFETNFEISEEVQEFIDSKQVEYIHTRDIPLEKVEFDGITLKKHQNIALDYMSKYREYCIFLGPGTGKTLIALTFIAMHINANKKETRSMYYIVFTPAKAIDQYIQEAKKYIPDAHVFDARKEYPQAMYKYNIGIINYESAHKLNNKITYDALILDESHKCKSSSTLVHRTIRKLHADNTYLFSGTPQDKNRHEVFAQFMLMNPELMSVKYLFMERFFVLDEYNNPIKERRPEELAEIIEKISYGDDSENLLDLPESNDYIVPCDLGKNKKLYTKFSKTKVIKSKKGWYALGDTPPKFRSKKTQICSGFVIDENGTSHRTPYNPKEKPFLETLNKCDKAIIYTCYDEEQVIVSELLKGKKFAKVNGKLTKKECDKAIQDMKDGNINYLVMQIKSGNAALDFPMIDNVIYYSLHDSYIFYEQSKYRIRRLGKKNPCNYYYLLTKGTVERDRYRAVKNKKNFNDQEKNHYRRRV